MSYQLITFPDAPITIRFTVICTNALTSQNAPLTSFCYSELKISTFRITVSVQASTLANVTSKSVSCSCNVNFVFPTALVLTAGVVVGWTGTFTL